MAVVATRNVRHNGVDYVKGQEIEGLTDLQAQQLLEVGAVEDRQGEFGHLNGENTPESTPAPTAPAPAANPDPDGDTSDEVQPQG